MPDDPNTAEGRAKMRRQAERELEDAQVAVDAWTGTVEQIKDMQRQAGDPTT